MADKSKFWKGGIFRNTLTGKKVCLTQHPVNNSKNECRVYNEAHCRFDTVFFWLSELEEDTPENIKKQNSEKVADDVIPT